MKRPIPQGLLVAVEGIDGAGKTSIATVIAQWCGERGLACTMSKEPTGLKWGTELRKSAQEGRLPIERELELFELDRRDHVERTIKPALAEGQIVILDRYYWSNAAYQGCRGVDWHKIIETNEKFAPKPDLFLVLDLDVDAGLERIRSRGDKPNSFEAKNALRRARQIFQQLAESSSSNAYTIDSGRHFKDTADEALLAFQRVAMDKIATSGPLRPDMLNRVLEFYGGERIQSDLPVGTPEMNALLAEAKKTSEA
jgi:dTMP kinase